MSRVVSILLAAFFLFLIFELTRRRKLKEKYAILWIAVGVIIFVLAIFDKLLFLITNCIGVKTPINAMIFLGVFFILLINLHFSLVISNLSEQLKKLAQQFALLEQKNGDKNRTS